MMAEPDIAIAGLELGFANYIGMNRSYVTVTRTVPDLYGARRLANGWHRSDGSRGLQTSLFAVSYEVLLPVDGSPQLLHDVEQELAAMNDASREKLAESVASSLAEVSQGRIVAEVTVIGVVVEVVYPNNVTATAAPSGSDVADARGRLFSIAGLLEPETLRQLSGISGIIGFSLLNLSLVSVLVQMFFRQKRLNKDRMRMLVEIQVPKKTNAKESSGVVEEEKRKSNSSRERVVDAYAKLPS
jgi:hypothetical protein